MNYNLILPNDLLLIETNIICFVFAQFLFNCRIILQGNASSEIERTCRWILFRI